MARGLRSKIGKRNRSALRDRVFREIEQDRLEKIVAHAKQRRRAHEETGMADAVKGEIDTAMRPAAGTKPERAFSMYGISQRETRF